LQRSKLVAVPIATVTEFQHIFFDVLAQEERRAREGDDLLALISNSVGVHLFFHNFFSSPVRSRGIFCVQIYSTASAAMADTRLCTANVRFRE
jgi:hypothetical protein